MFPLEAFAPVLTDFMALMQKYGIRFHLTGGMISGTYSEPRFTQDMDVVVDPQATRKNQESLIQDLKHNYLFDPMVVREAIENGRPFQLLNTNLMLKLDIYPRELVAGELSRSVDCELFPGVHVPVVSRCDLAVAKLIWIGKGSHKSRTDLRRILSRATDEERTTVAQTAADLSLSHLLELVLSETDNQTE